MIDYFILSSAHIKSFLNDYFLSESRRAIKTIMVLILSLFFVGAVYWIFARVLYYFKSVEIFGNILCIKLLSMIFFAFFVMLIFSNISVSISSTFLSSDINLLMALPLRRKSILLSRFTKTIIHSSWMILFLSIPIFLSYGIVFGGDLFFYLKTLSVMLPFLIISCGIGMIFTMGLMSLFPARATRDITMLLGIILVSIFLIAVRLLRPEKLIEPSAMLLLSRYISDLEAPIAPYLPGHWASNILASHLFKDGSSLTYHVLLWGCAFFFVILLLLLSNSVYFKGWCAAQESLHKRRNPSDIKQSRMIFSGRSALYSFIVKDVKLFIRDSTQWSQLLLLLTIIILYVFNVRTLPAYYASETRMTSYMRDILFFLNVGFGGFIITAVAARFAFPSISLEGKNLWLIKLSPISPSKIIFEKYITSLVPIFIFSMLLITVSIYIMNVDYVMASVSLLTVALFSFSITGLAVGMGAILPKFEVENTSQIVTGVGGLAFMMLGTIYVCITMFLEAGPLRAYYWSLLISKKMDLLYVGIITLFILILNAVVFSLPLFFGTRLLAKRDL